MAVFGFCGLSRFCGFCSYFTLINRLFFQAILADSGPMRHDEAADCSLLKILILMTSDVDFWF